jgi:hypothetical protein
VHWCRGRFASGLKPTWQLADASRGSGEAARVGLGNVLNLGLPAPPPLRLKRTLRRTSRLRAFGGTLRPLPAANHTGTVHVRYLCTVPCAFHRSLVEFSPRRWTENSALAAAIRLSPTRHCSVLVERRLHNVRRHPTQQILSE